MIKQKRTTRKRSDQNQIIFSELVHTENLGHRASYAIIILVNVVSLIWVLPLSVVLE